MKLSIIIPTLNEEAYIPTLLKDIEAQTVQPFEVIVVDCGSIDKTQSIVKSIPGVKLVKANKPVANQRSYGGKMAHGELLLFLDADVKLHPDFLASSLKEFRDNKLSIACPSYIPYPGSLSINLFYQFFNKLFKFSDKHFPSGAGSGIFVLKKLFIATGGFDSLVKFDDIKFIRSAGKKGTFGILNTSIQVSDRRIRFYGLFPTIITYTILAIFFLFGAYRTANIVPYKFGIFQKKLFK